MAFSNSLADTDRKGKNSVPLPHTNFTGIEHNNSKEIVLRMDGSTIPAEDRATVASSFNVGCAGGISGIYKALLPMAAWRPRFHPVTVRFGWLYRVDQRLDSHDTSPCACE